MVLSLCLAACSTAASLGELNQKNLYSFCRPQELDGGLEAVRYFPISEPITVRQIKGMIISENWHGSWGDWRPTLYLRGPGKSQRTYKIRGDATGRIVIGHLAMGSYCFLATAGGSGYHGAYGIIIIDKKADPKNEIRIELPFAVP
jgi:hypothetical protein